MKLDRLHFLSLPRPPGCLSVQEAAWYLGFEAHDIPLLMGKGLIKPIGSPPPHATKYFCPIVMEKLRINLKWKGRARDFLVKYWQGTKEPKLAGLRVSGGEDKSKG